MRRFTVARGKHTEVRMECKDDHLVPVKNVSAVPQIVGATKWEPGETLWIPAAVARGLDRLDYFAVAWPHVADCQTMQIDMHLGLGDNIFLLAACNAYHAAKPEVNLYVDTRPEHEGWLKWVPFVKFGLAPGEAQYVNLTAIPQHGFDRTSLIASILGVEVTNMCFPISVPRLPVVPTEPYWVFAPFNSGRSLRTLQRPVIDTVLSKVPEYATNGNIVIVDSKPYETAAPCINLCGGTTLEDVWSLVQHSEGVISVDSGIAWIAVALGKPVLIFFGHFPANQLIMTAKTAWSVEPSVPCYPCGCPGWPPECTNKQVRPVACMDYPPEMVLYKTLEFLEVARADVSTQDQA